MTATESICVISSGVVHAVSRTLALADHFPVIHFVDLRGNLEESDFSAKENIKLHSLSRWGKSPLAYWDFIKLVRQLNSRVIICHYASGYHFFLSLIFGNAPVAAICMGKDILYDQGDTYVPSGKRFLIREGLRHTSYLSAKSRYLKERIRTYQVKRPVDINYWGCDLRWYQKKDKESMRRLLGLKSDTKVILSPRAVAPVYHIELIIKAFARLFGKHSDAKLLILGRMGHVEYVASLKSLVQELGIKNMVEWVGEVRQTEITTYYCAADIVVSVAQGEGFPNTLLEVMGSEVPVVCGRIPQIEELLTHKKNTWFCDFTEESVCDGIMSLLSDTTMSKKIADGGKQIVLKHGDINRNGQLFSQRIKEVMNVTKNNNLLWRIAYGGAVFGYLLIDRVKRFGRRVA